MSDNHNDNCCKDLCDCCECHEWNDCCNNCCGECCGCYSTEMCAGCCDDCCNGLCSNCSPACRGVSFCIIIIIIIIIVGYFILHSQKII